MQLDHFDHSADVMLRNDVLDALLAQAEAGQNSRPEQAMRLLVQILGYERQGRQRELLESRRSAARAARGVVRRVHGQPLRFGAPTQTARQALSQR